MSPIGTAAGRSPIVAGERVLVAGGAGLVLASHDVRTGRNLSPQLRSAGRARRLVVEADQQFAVQRQLE